MTNIAREAGVARTTVEGYLQILERGILFEGLVAQLLRACRDYRSLCDDKLLAAGSLWDLPPYGRRRRH